jgi:hypothetical protein
MNLYKERVELEETKEKNKEMADILLDYYKHNPKECEKLLSQIVEINKDLEEIEKDLDEIEKEINNEIY